VVCGAGARGASVAASGTVPMGGLFGAVLSTPVGALIVSCEGSFWADATPTVTNSVAATNSDCVFIIVSCPVPTINIDEFVPFLGQGARTGLAIKIAILHMELWNFPGVY
jgi:hypothetical protein